MRSTTNALELFYLAEVVGKGTASQNMQDQNGHTILSNEMYIQVIYLQKKSESLKGVKYQRSQSDPVLIHVPEIFATNIAINGNLQMDIEEYQAISSAAL